MAKHEIWELKQMQSLPLEAKIQMTRTRIRGWIDEFGEDGVYVSFSGGKDSTVLLDIVRKDYPDVQAVFINTGLEYPSVRLFAESKENVTTIRPSMIFRDVIIKYGYPIISKEVAGKAGEVRKSIAKGNTNTVRYRQFMGLEMKENGEPSEYNVDHYKYLLDAPFNISDRCCEIMKKSPAHKYNKKHNRVPIIGVMADESRQRKAKWLKNGCNAFDLKNPESNPLSFWTENDVLEYIHKYNLPIAEAYGEVVVVNNGIAGQISMCDILSDYRGCKFATTGCQRTGCIFCMFGITQDKERFIRLAEQESKLCDYVMRGGEFNDEGMWQPSNDGLGYWFVIEWLNVQGGLEIGFPNRQHYIEKYSDKRTMQYLEKKK